MACPGFLTVPQGGMSAPPAISRGEGTLRHAQRAEARRLQTRDTPLKPLQGHVVSVHLQRESDSQQHKPEDAD